MTIKYSGLPFTKKILLADIYSFKIQIFEMTSPNSRTKGETYDIEYVLKNGHLKKLFTFDSSLDAFEALSDIQHFLGVNSLTPKNK